MKKNIGISLVKYEGKFYLFTSKREMFEVNELGARIFDLCNGVNTIDDITNKLGSIFDVDKNTLKLDIEQYIKELVDLKVIEK